ncbi:MAG: hypothetical protein OEQ53_02665 [Saprospiraceae bacterium]|nr:hypothetical protein [Saprospiraceae bacterium]
MKGAVLPCYCAAIVQISNGMLLELGLAQLPLVLATGYSSSAGSYFGRVERDSRID